MILGRYGYNGGNTAGIRACRLLEKQPKQSRRACRAIWIKLEYLLKNRKYDTAMVLMQCCIYKGFITNEKCYEAIDRFVI